MEDSDDSMEDSDDSMEDSDDSMEDSDDKPGYVERDSTGSSVHTVVGIGASAGGLAALRSFFERVPSDSDLSFVVVMHLSPEHKSHLAELLQPHVRMPVQQVTETVPLEPNQVYVIPPNANIESIDTHLRLTKIEERRRERAPIDHFLRTLARTHDGHAIAVILSGTGSDGALGIREIKESGGLAIAQLPSEAEYDGMPQSAISTGVVDIVLPVAEIADAILRFVRTNPRVEVPAHEDDVDRDVRPLLHKIFAQVRARTGRDFSRYKRSTILRRIMRRMQLRHIEELTKYLELLRGDLPEVRALADDLLITVTAFFRDPEVFTKLEKDILPELFAHKAAEHDIRVWTVGCATGEEAYSWAMLLLEEAARHEAPPRLQVFASDLHEYSLERAREGFYPGDIEADVSAERLRRYFQKEEGGYRIRKEVRELVVFAPHNLLGDPPFSRIDLISCRNLLIYMQRDAQSDIAELFHYALRPNGILVLGSSETADRSELFRTEDKRLCIYRKRDVPTPEPRLPVFPLTRSYHNTDFARPERASERVAYGTMHQRMVERYAPPSMLVNSDDKIVHLSEHAGRFLVQPGGELTANVFKLVRDELRLDLRTAIHGAREKGLSTTTKPARVRFEGAEGWVVLHVRPTLDPHPNGFVLVIFEENTNTSTGAATGALSVADSEVAAQVRTQIDEVEAELDHTRERLQAIIEEFETTQEEMKAANEELQSTNEELRSTMEELETSKEELQSMNEELQTVNQENRHKVEELAQISADLQSLLASTDIATIFLDRELRIMRFTPKVGELFNVRMTDRGRLISDLTNRLGYDELVQDAQAVLDRLAPLEREIEDEGGQWFLTRVLPYRAAEDRIAGVVITLVDITSRKRAEEALRRTELAQRLSAEAARVGTWQLDTQADVYSISQQMAELMGYSHAPHAGADGPWHLRVPQAQWMSTVHAADRMALVAAVTEAIEKRAEFELEYRIVLGAGSTHWLYSKGQAALDASSGRVLLSGASIDVTDRKRLDDTLREADRRKDEFMATLGHELRNPMGAIQSAVKLLRTDEVPSDVLESALDILDRQSRQMGRLIDDLLDVSRITRGVITLHEAPIDLAETISEVSESVRSACEKMDKRLIVSLPADTLVVWGDRTRLLQVVGNLLNNAAKFTDRGGRIDLSLQRQNEHAVITVTDTGIGIAAEQLERVFEAFTHARIPPNESRGGLGLGLSLARTLVELHRGTVQASSEGPGKGSVFTVQLPLLRQPVRVTKKAQRVRGSPRAPAKSQRILVVDDNQDSATVLSHLLRTLGHEVHMAHDGEQAVAAEAELRPDVAILDIGMPVVDGYEAARRIRGRDGKKQPMLIALSGWGQPGDVHRAKAAGFDLHMTKPLDFELLKHALDSAEDLRRRA